MATTPDTAKPSQTQQPVAVPRADNPLPPKGTPVPVGFSGTLKRIDN